MDHEHGTVEINRDHAETNRIQARKASADTDGGGCPAPADASDRDRF
jgi:hypothetical protein